MKSTMSSQNNLDISVITSEIDKFTQQYNVLCVPAIIKANCTNNKYFYRLPYKMRQLYEKNTDVNGVVWNVKNTLQKEFLDYLYRKRCIKLDEIKTDTNGAAPYHDFVLLLNFEQRNIIYCQSMTLTQDYNVVRHINSSKGYCPYIQGYYNTISFDAFKNNDIFIKFCKFKWMSAYKKYNELCKEIENHTFNDYREYLELKKKRKIEQRKAKMMSDFG